MTELKKMSIHRALTELKTLEERIEKATSEAITAVASRKSSDKINGVPVDEFEASIQGTYDKVVSLIAYRNRIKDAVVQSNATTIINVSGKEMTVAKGIERKDSILYEKRLLQTMTLRYNKAVATVNKENEALPQKLETYLTNILGSREKASKDDVELHTRTFTERNEWVLIDPLKAAERIEKLREEIYAFEAEIDAVLSESNAITTIEIEA